MTTVQLIHHLIWLFAHCPRVRRELLTFYRNQLPGMPRDWYSMYVRDMIGDYPQAMRACVASFHHGYPTAASYRTCP